LLFHSSIFYPEYVDNGNIHPFKMSPLSTLAKPTFGKVC
jgi:hypothetical protein